MNALQLDPSTLQSFSVRKGMETFSDRRQQERSTLALACAFSEQLRRGANRIILDYALAGVKLTSNCREFKQETLAGQAKQCFTCYPATRPLLRHWRKFNECASVILELEARTRTI